ncbi:hypothetical protein [Salinilacihabitans rarus]|uniref:hypothetical protein n=1 Tax=Salinilacihabitans rarus TaxID=2961596 RepID=UPI0020C83CF5|nr:hypothetical protein [Salinilacihabitans rarus]
MSDESGLREVVVEEVTEQVDVGRLVDGESLQDQFDGATVGESVFGRLGERLGREIGASVGASVHEALERGLEEGESLRDLLDHLVEAVREGLRAVFGGEGPGDVRSLVDETAEAAGIDGLVPEPEADEVPEAEAEEAAEPGAEAADEAPAEAAEMAETEDGPSVEDLEELRTETLRDFLSMLSYTDLQSIAKDLDVRANLSREEMTDRIVETVADGGEQ